MHLHKFVNGGEQILSMSKNTGEANVMAVKRCKLCNYETYSIKTKTINESEIINNSNFNNSSFHK